MELKENTKPIFEGKTLERARELIGRYPTPQGALLPVLWLAQETHGWLSRETLRGVAELLELPLAHVYGVVTFYHMFHLHPPGKYHLALCSTLPCALGGCREIENRIREKLGIGHGETTEDGLFELRKVECLGACDKAPAMMVNDDLHENLTVEQAEQLIDELAAESGKEPGFEAGS